MYGRSGSRLLAILLFLLPPVFLRGQSDRPGSSSPVAPRLASQPALDFALTPPRWLVPPEPGLPRMPVSPPGAIGFAQVARAAGIIFSGTVTSVIRRPASRGQPVETVAITFHVENAIRGVTPGQDLTISQWMGLWSGGQRYRVGERVLLCL